MTTALRRTALAVLGLLVLVAGSATAPATAVQPGYGTITGVVRSPDGAPAAGVRVVAMEEGTGPDYLGAEGTTDAAGRYRIEALAGGYDLRTNDARGRFAKADVLGLDVRDGGVTTRDVTVERGLTVSGRVARADGGSVDGVQVQLTIPDPRFTFYVVVAIVGPDGSWTARGLHRGTWRGLVDPVAPTDARYVVHDLTGRALPDRDERAGSPVTVAGDVTVPTTTLRHRTPVVRGTVRGVGGRPVAGATVHTDDEDWWLDDGESAPFPGIGDTTGADGRYELRLDRAGRTYPLYVSTAATGYAVLPFKARVPGLDQTTTADVRLRSTARATAEVRSRRGKQAKIRVTYVPAVAGASRVAAVTVRYKAASGKARKARGTLDRRGVLAVRLPEAKRGLRTIKVHVAGNADAVPVTRTVRARVR